MIRPRLALAALFAVSLAAPLACTPPIDDDDNDGDDDGDGDDDDDDDGDPVPGDDFESCIPDFDDGPIFKETLTLAVENGGLRVRIVRRPGDGPVVGETFAFELLGFALAEDGEMTACVVDPAALDYVYEHHNWDEEATATTEPRTLTLTMTYDVASNTWLDLLRDSSAGEAVILGIEACVSEGPSPANGCFQRQ